MFTYKIENEKLKKELSDLRYDYEDKKEELEYTQQNNLKLLKVNDILSETINKLEKESIKNQWGSVTNLQNKIKTILADCKSKLVSSK